MRADLIGKINVTVNKANTNSNSDKVEKTKDTEAIKKTETEHEELNKTSEQAKEAKQQEVALTKEDIKEAVDRVSDYVQNIQRELLFNVDNDSGEVIVRVVDSQTQEIVRQIPSEEILKIAKSLEQASGSILSEKA